MHPRCVKHDLDAVLRTSYTIGNNGRKFWICPLRPNKGSKEEDCKFFHWHDELDPPTTPKKSQMPVSPTKRTSPFKSDPARHQKRLKAIQDALSESNNATAATTPTTTTTTRRARLEAQIREARATPQTPASLANATTATKHPPSAASSGARIFNLSDLGLDLSGHRPTVVRTHAEPPPPPPPPPPIHSPPPTKETLSSLSEDELWSAFHRESISSPSQDSQDEIADELFDPTPSPEEFLRSGSSAKAKGKQRAEEQDAEEEEAFWTQPATNTSPLGLFSPRISTSVPALVHPLHHPINLNQISDPGLTGEKIRSLVTSLVGVPEYIISLEKRIVEIQKIDESKTRRIQELEREVEMLKHNATFL